MAMDFAGLFAASRREQLRLLENFASRQIGELETLAGWCAETLRSGGKLLLFGNGGSAAQAQHLAAEFVNRFEQPRAALAAVALTTDGSVLTSIGNDNCFEQIFARQIEALGRPGDLALAFSTSGASPNLVHGLRAGRNRRLRTAAMLGRDGGGARHEVDLALVIRGTETARIQEVQMFAGHLICQWVDRLLAPATDERSISAES